MVPYTTTPTTLGSYGGWKTHTLLMAITKGLLGMDFDTNTSKAEPTPADQSQYMSDPELAHTTILEPAAINGTEILVISPSILALTLLWPMVLTVASLSCYCCGYY